MKKGNQWGNGEWSLRTALPTGSLRHVHFQWLGILHSGMIWAGWAEEDWWFALGYRGSCWGCSLVYHKGRCGMNGCRDFKANFLLFERSLTVADWVSWKPSALSLQGLKRWITDVAPLTPGTPPHARDGQVWLTPLLHDLLLFNGLTIKKINQSSIIHVDMNHYSLLDFWNITPCV